MLQEQPWSAPACTRVLVGSTSGADVSPKDAINLVNGAPRANLEKEPNFVPYAPQPPPTPLGMVYLPLGWLGDVFVRLPPDSPSGRHGREAIP